MRKKNFKKKQDEVILAPTESLNTDRYTECLNELDNFLSLYRSQKYKMMALHLSFRADRWVGKRELSRRWERRWGSDCSRASAPSRASSTCTGWRRPTGPPPRWTGSLTDTCTPDTFCPRKSTPDSNCPPGHWSQRNSTRFWDLWRSRINKNC